MTLSDLITVFGHSPLGGYNPQAAESVKWMTRAQVDLLLRNPKDIKDEPGDPITERGIHRETAIANCWPEWLEEKLWRETHPDP